MINRPCAWRLGSYGPDQPYYPCYGNYYGGPSNTYINNNNVVSNYYGPTFASPPGPDNPGSGGGALSPPLGPRLVHYRKPYYLTLFAL